MASIVFRLKRGSDADHDSYLGAHSELTHQSTNHGLVIHEHYEGIVTELEIETVGSAEYVPSISFEYSTTTISGSGSGLMYIYY